jgi:uncharacterized membrane protein
MEQKRWKSPVVWAAVVAQVLSILILFDIINPAQQEVINGVVVAVLQLLTVFGILNNPTDQKNF